MPENSSRVSWIGEGVGIVRTILVAGVLFIAGYVWQNNGDTKQIQSDLTHLKEIALSVAANTKSIILIEAQLANLTVEDGRMNERMDKIDEEFDKVFRRNSDRDTRSDNFEDELRNFDRRLQEMEKGRARYPSNDYEPGTQ